MSKPTNSSGKFFFSDKAFRIVIIYLVLSLFWIFSTDKLVFHLIPDTETQNLVSSIKGWFFVIATTLLLYYLIRQALKEKTTAEKKLIESEIKFRSVFENSVDAIGVSKEGKHLFVNPAYLSLFGYSHDELVGKPILDLIAPSQHKFIGGLVVRRARGEEVPHNYETVGLKKDGSKFEMDVNVSSYHLNYDHYTLVVLRDISARKKAEYAIRESEQRYQTLANISPVGIFRTDAGGNTTYVSPIWCEISGLSSQEAMGEGWFNAVYYEDREKLSVNWKEATSGHNVSLAEYRFIHKDGSIVWVLGQAVPERNFENQIIGYVGTITNITEQKHVEEELKKSEIKYKNLFEFNPHPMWVYDIETFKFLDVNDAAVLQYGYSREEFKSMTLTDIRPKEELEKFFEYTSNLRPNFRKSSDWLHLKKDGTVIIVEISSHDMAYEGKKARLVLSTDITERKKAEETAKESERRFTEIMKSVNLVSLILDPNGKISFCNKYLLDLTGYTSEEVLNNNWFDLFIPQEILEPVKNIFSDAVLKDSLPLHIENEIIAKNGDRKLISWNNTVLKDTKGKIIGTASIGEDITEKTRLEEELIKTSQQIRALSAHHQKIREDERAAIAREMHDELGQILTSLKMNIVFTRRELEESKTIDVKNKILAEFQSMNMTIDKAVSQIRKLITQLRPELLDKLGLIAALEWYSEEYQKTTRINCVFTSESEELFLDHDVELAIFRIVQEAMTNSAKHSGAKSILIRLSKSGTSISIEITDDGKGILESELDGATSFGLMGMRERASLIGGRLEISGIPGKGTTVRLVVDR